MLKLRFAPFAAIGLTAAIAFAQESAAPAGSKPDTVKVESAAKPGPSDSAPVKRAPIRRVSKPVVKATPVPVATPVPKKQGFWTRLFGKKKATPAPATPTPAPVKKKIVKKPRPTQPNVADTGSTDSTPDSNKGETTKAETTKPTEEVTPPVKNETPVKPTAKSGKPKKGGENVQTFPPSTDNADAEAVEKQKYDQARAKAVADPKVQELRSKADLAPSEDESRKALRAYNKAMFKRMKEIDPSIKDHIDRMEAAVMSRLGE